MQARRLHQIITLAIASTVGGGGSTACTNCTEQSSTQSFQINEDNYQNYLTVLASAEPVIDGSVSVETQGDAGSFEEWKYLFLGEPCQSVCQELVGGVATADCETYIADNTINLSCPVTQRVCMNEDEGCSLGKGRPRAGFALRPSKARDVRGRYFEEAAQLEAASVASFDVLARDLVHHGAPGRLVAASHRAGRDEVRHARIMSSLARRYGGESATPFASDWRPREIEAIAIENAIDGCVRETYAALDATWMAQNARCSRVRRALSSVAKDETRHGALAWQVAAWAQRRLSKPARERIALARTRAVRDLARELSRSPSPALIMEGLAPPSIVRVSMLASLERQLRSDARS